jgi:sulfoxide reductase catalytic subunit YedY
MISFDAAHRAVHYPPDRRFRIWIRPSILIGTAIVVLGLIAASWIQVAVAGLPQIPALFLRLQTATRAQTRLRRMKNRA